MGCEKELLILGLLCVLGRCSPDCDQGFEKKKGQECVDLDECEDKQCVNNTKCFNTIGSFYCQCLPGYRNPLQEVNVTGHGQCIDVNECVEGTDICGNAANCSNQLGSYTCTCHFGYTNSSSDPRNPNCIELDCASFSGDGGPPSPPGLAHILSMMRNSCLALSNPSNAGERKTDGEALLEKLFTATEALLSPGHLGSSGGVSGLLGTVENAIMLIGPQLKHNFTKLETNETDAEIAVQRGKTRPTGPIHLTNENAALDTDWTTAAGTGSYPGFALAALVSYKNLEKSVNSSFDKITGYEKDGVTPTFQISSKVVSVVVSNPSTQNLNRHVQITFKHLQDTENVTKGVYICAYWDESGAWSTHGCTQKNTSATHTVCTCGHLSSFAVLMALYPIENSFELQVLTKIVLTISLLCLVLCILTFQFCRSIQGTRTTIHLHLCICLFMADLIFLAGISQTDPVGGCRFVAAMLHFFFLGVFTWMLLEGVQLYRMVVLVFNANMRTLYLLVSGYGVPLVIVIISAIIRPSGYGTDDYCWLSLKDGLIWSFFGPVCIIIILNVFFFIVTVWKLAQKFTSLNPDLTKLNKIKAFTVTAIAQMCILGLMWVFGAFLFQEGTTALAYIFTILNGLQGALVFIMHCLLSKQVREEYAHFLSCICTPQKKRYSDFSSTNPSSSQSQGTRSGQHTGESQI